MEVRGRTTTVGGGGGGGDMGCTVRGTHRVRERVWWRTKGGDEVDEARATPSRRTTRSPRLASLVDSTTPTGHLLHESSPPVDRSLALARATPTRLEAVHLISSPLSPPKAHSAYHSHYSVPLARHIATPGNNLGESTRFSRLSHLGGETARATVAAHAPHSAPSRVPRTCHRPPNQSAQCPTLDTATLLHRSTRSQPPLWPWPP